MARLDRPIQAEADELARTVGESRWPMAGAVVAAITLTILLPEEQRAVPQGVFPLIEGVLLVALVAADPGAIDRRSRVLGVISIGLVSVLVVSALLATERLIDVLISGGPQTNSASDLLQAGSIIWVSGILAFALLYGELDRVARRPALTGRGTMSTSPSLST